MLRFDDNVKNKNMISCILPANSLASVPELVRRLGLIMVELAAVVAMRFLCMPQQGETTVAVWGRLQNLTRPVVARPGVVRRVGVRLPQGRGWLDGYRLASGSPSETARTAPNRISQKAADQRRSPQRDALNYRLAGSGIPFGHIT